MLRHDAHRGQGCVTRQWAGFRLLRSSGYLRARNGCLRAGRWCRSRLYHRQRGKLPPQPHPARQGLLPAGLVRLQPGHRLTVALRKGIRPVGMLLVHRICAQHPAAKAHEHPADAGLSRCQRKAAGIVQVGRPVGTERTGRPHGPRQ